MTPTLIVLVLVAIGVAAVVWAVRRKPADPVAAPTEDDTAWKDQVHPEAPHRPAEPPRDQPLP